VAPKGRRARQHVQDMRLTDALRWKRIDAKGQALEEDPGGQCSEIGDRHLPGCGRGLGQPELRDDGRQDCGLTQRAFHESPPLETRETQKTTRGRSTRPRLASFRAFCPTGRRRQVPRDSPAPHGIRIVPPVSGRRAVQTVRTRARTVLLNPIRILSWPESRDTRHAVWTVQNVRNRTGKGKRAGSRPSLVVPFQRSSGPARIADSGFYWTSCQLNIRTGVLFHGLGGWLQS